MFAIVVLFYAAILFSMARTLFPKVARYILGKSFAMSIKSSNSFLVSRYIFAFLAVLFVCVLAIVVSFMRVHLSSRAN